MVSSTRKRKPLRLSPFSPIPEKDPHTWFLTKASLKNYEGNFFFSINDAESHLFTWKTELFLLAHIILKNSEYQNVESKTNKFTE